MSLKTYRKTEGVTLIKNLLELDSTKSHTLGKFYVTNLRCEGSGNASAEKAVSYTIEAQRRGLVFCTPPIYSKPSLEFSKN